MAAVTDRSQFYLWTIYERPADYPEGYVVRRWVASPGVGGPKGLDAVKAETLEAARELVPEGAVRMVREDGDDPAVLETWF